MIKHTFPPGFYFIGDPTHTLDHVDIKEWEELIDFEDAEFLFEFHGCPVATGFTSEGNGEYEGITVESGMLAIIHADLITKPDWNQNLGLFIGIDEPFDVFIKEGYFEFGDIIVDTIKKVKPKFNPFEYELDWDYGD